jgi:hypothetical protein
LAKTLGSPGKILTSLNFIPGNESFRLVKEYCFAVLVPSLVIFNNLVDVKNSIWLSLTWVNSTIDLGFSPIADSICLNFLSKSLKSLAFSFSSVTNLLIASKTIVLNYFLASNVPSDS